MSKLPPMAGPILGETSPAEANENIHRFVCDLADSPRNLNGVETTVCHELDGGGRYGYVLSGFGPWTTAVRMPGLPLEKVRYSAGVDEHAWDYAMLYVDGEHYWWRYALDAARAGLLGAADYHGPAVSKLQELEIGQALKVAQPGNEVKTGEWRRWEKGEMWFRHRLFDYGVDSVSSGGGACVVMTGHDHAIEEMLLREMQLAEAGAKRVECDPLTGEAIKPTTTGFGYSVTALINGMEVPFYTVTSAANAVTGGAPTYKGVEGMAWVTPAPVKQKKKLPATRPEDHVVARVKRRLILDEEGLW